MEDTPEPSCSTESVKPSSVEGTSETATIVSVEPSGSSPENVP